MKYFYLLFIVFIVGGGNFAIAQTPGINKSVLLSAEVQPNPPRITLNWEPFSSPATAISILKKEKDATGWQTTVASNLSGSTTSWTDTNVAVGVVYEYKVQKSGTNPAEGYITSGI